MFADHFRQMYEDVMTVMRIRTFQLIILQVLPYGAHCLCRTAMHVPVCDQRLSVLLPCR